jgi:hypothetical protein
MKRYVLLDNEHNDTIYTFETNVDLDLLWKGYLESIVDKDDGEDAQYSFSNWLRDQPDVFGIYPFELYVYGYVGGNLRLEDEEGGVL